MCGVLHNCEVIILFPFLLPLYYIHPFINLIFSIFLLFIKECVCGHDFLAILISNAIYIYIDISYSELSYFVTGKFNFPVF